MAGVGVNKTKQFVFVASAAALFTYFGSKTNLSGTENRALDNFKNRKAQVESIAKDTTYQEYMQKVEAWLNDAAKNLEAYENEKAKVRAEDSTAKANDLAKLNRIADSTKNAEKLLSEKKPADSLKIVNENVLVEKDKSDSLKAANERIAELKRIADSTGNAIVLEKKRLEDSLATATKLETKRIADSLTVLRNAEAQRKADSLKAVELGMKKMAAQYNAARDSVLNAYDYVTKNDWMLENAGEALTAKFKLILEFVEKNAKTYNVELYRDFYAVKELVKGREKYFADQKAKLEEEKKRREGLEVIESSPLRIDTSSAIVPIKVPDTTGVKAPERKEADSTNKEQVEPTPLKKVAVPKNEKPPVKENNEPPRIKEENSGKETIKW